VVVSRGYYLEGKTPEILAEEIAGYVALGLPALKMKIGREDPPSDEARIAVVRRTIGPEILLMLDANNAWSDVPTTVRHVDRPAPYERYWIEELFSPDQIENPSQAGRS
jgi:L-alanine-DL-glutamate epimerase-like enolase superfamily enzyme